MEICEICKEKPQIPHWLPCSHVFCYLCIRKHLDHRNFCPKCFDYPFNVINFKTNEEIKSKLKTPILLFSPTVEALKRELKKFRINTSGSLAQLKWRYKELCYQIDNDKFKEVPRSTDTIAKHIHLTEVALSEGIKEIDTAKVHKKLLQMKIKIRRNEDLEEKAQLDDCTESNKDKKNLIDFFKNIKSRGAKDQTI